MANPLKTNAEKAREHFEAVDRMLDAYENISESVKNQLEEEKEYKEYWPDPPRE